MHCLNTHMTFGWPADMTFELLVDKGRSEVASLGYTPTATGYSTMAIGYLGQMSPSLQPATSTFPQPARKCEFTVRYSYPSDSLPEPCGVKHLTPSCMFSFTLAKHGKLSINTHAEHSQLFVYSSRYPAKCNKWAVTHTYRHKNNISDIYTGTTHPLISPSFFKCHMWSACVPGTMRGIGFPGKT